MLQIMLCTLACPIHGNGCQATEKTHYPSRALPDSSIPLFYFDEKIKIAQWTVV